MTQKQVEMFLEDDKEDIMDSALSQSPLKVKVDGLAKVKSAYSAGIEARFDLHAEENNPFLFPSVSSPPPPPPPPPAAAAEEEEEGEIEEEQSYETKASISGSRKRKRAKVDDGDDADGSEAEERVAKSRKLAADEQMVKTRKLADVVRGLDADKRSSIEATIRLGDLETSTIMVVLDGEVFNGIHGELLISNVTYVDSDGKKQNRRIMMGTRFKPEGKNPYPCCMYFGGKVKGKPGAGFIYDVHHAGSGTEKEMMELAQTLRKLILAELQAKFSVARMKDFKAGTVFAYSAVRTINTTVTNKEGERVKNVGYLLKYETIVDGKTLSGEVFIPQRIYVEAKKNMPGVLVYDGKATGSKSGREYDALKVMKNVEGLMDEAAASAPASKIKAKKPDNA